MTVVKTKGGVMDLDIDLDEVRAEDERERVRILMEETASAARQEAIAQALSELEHEIEKVVRVELAEVIKERKLPPRTLSQYRDDLAAFRAWCAAYPVALPHRPAAPQTVAAFLGHLATIGGNVRRAAKAISRFHRNAAIDDIDPVNDALVQAVLAFVKKYPPRGKAAIT
jgi:hypothetical protein